MFSLRFPVPSDAFLLSDALLLSLIDRLRAVFLFLRPAGRRAFRRERRRKAEKAMVSNAAIAQPRAALVGDLLCIYRVNMVSNISMAWWRVDMLPFAVSPSRLL